MSGCDKHYQYSWHAVATNQIFLNEPPNHFLCHMRIIVGLYLFSEVVDGYLDEFLTFAGLWTNWSYSIQSLHAKRLMRGHFEQQC